jgi:hypothetical protein
MRIALLALLALPVLPAQDFRGQIRMKPLLPPLDKAWKAPKNVLAIPRAPATTTCSIPPLSVEVVEADPKMAIAPPAKGFAVRVVTPPAPSCEPRK